MYFRSSCSTSCRTYSCLNTFLLLLGPSYLSWAGLCLRGGSLHRQLGVIHAVITCFTNLTILQSFLTDEQSIYSSYSVSPLMHGLVLHIIELLLLLLLFSLSTSILTACCPNHLLYRYFLLAMDRQTLVSYLGSQNSTPFLYISKPSGNREKKKSPN